MGPAWTLTVTKGHAVQEWADKHDIHWHFHLPYDPAAARLMERMTGLLKQQLRWELALSTCGPGN